MMNKIFQSADPSLTERVVSQKDLIGTLFKEYLFASVFSGAASAGDSERKGMLELAKQKTKRKGKSSAAKGTKSREVAYQLLTDLIRKSPTIMNNFI